MTKLEQMRAQSQMKQYASNNITLDFEAIQNRSGVHSTLGHINQQSTTISNGPQDNNSQVEINNTLLLSNPLISNDNSNFNTTGLIHPIQSNGSLQQTAHIQKNASSIVGSSH